MCYFLRRFVSRSLHFLRAARDEWQAAGRQDEADSTNGLPGLLQGGQHSAACTGPVGYRQYQWLAVLWCYE